MGPNNAVRCANWTPKKAPHIHTSNNTNKAPTLNIHCGGHTGHACTATFWTPGKLELALQEANLLDSAGKIACTN
jgi:hypothetical protein